MAELTAEVCSFVLASFVEVDDAPLLDTLVVEESWLVVTGAVLDGEMLGLTLDAVDVFALVALDVD